MLTLRSREAVKRWQKRVGRLNVEENIKKWLYMALALKVNAFLLSPGKRYI